jgi:hypothetical protein
MTTPIKLDKVEVQQGSPEPSLFTVRFWFHEVSDPTKVHYDSINLVEKNSLVGDITTWAADNLWSL